MIKFDMRVFIPPGAIADPKKIIKAVENTLNMSAKAIQMEFIRTTGNWRHKPAFIIDSYPGKRIIYTDDAIYRYVAWGTRVRRVIMTGDFVAKSAPGSLDSGQGRGGVAFGPAKRISRPGIVARDFDTTIQMRWKKYFPEQMQRAIDSEFAGG